MIDQIKKALAVAARLRADLPAGVSDELAELEPSSGKPLHAFDHRNMHEKLQGNVRKLFDNGHYSEATFEAAKFLEKTVKKIAGIQNRVGLDLMMAAFNEDNPKIKMNALSTQSEIDEQRGIKFLFAGTSSAVRNPRGHEPDFPETVDECLDNLCVVSYLLRRLEGSGHRLN